MSIDILWEKIKGEDNLHFKAIFFLATMALILGLSKLYHGNIYLQQLMNRLDGLGVWWAPIVYIGMYILMSGIFFPSIVFKVLAGTLFGIFGGVVFASIAATISSLIKFSLARYFFRETISKRIYRNETLKTIDYAIKEDGWKVLLLLRNIPVFNSMFLNYLCGVSKIRMRDFVTASFIGRLPTTLMYVYLGYLAGYVSGIKRVDQAQINYEWILLWIGLCASVGLAYYVIYLSKKIFNEKQPSSL